MIVYYQFLKQTLTEQNTLYLDELQTKLDEAHGKRVSISTLSRVLKSLNITDKDVRITLCHWLTLTNYHQVTAEAAERSPLLRAGFGLEIGTFYRPHQLVFTDECYVDKRTTARQRGWANKGERAFVQEPFIRGKR